MGALALVLASVAAWWWPRSPLVAAASQRARTGQASPSERPARSAWARRQILVAVGGLSAAALVGLPWWGCVVAALIAGGVARYELSRPRPPRPADVRALAGALDLLGVCLDAGMSIVDAIGAAVSARPVLGGDELTEVAALMALGADPASAWRAAADCPELAPVAAAGELAGVGGVPMAQAARVGAEELRARCRAMGQRSAARAGLAMTAPLTLCFLPAFVCWGLAPVVMGLVSSVQVW